MLQELFLQAIKVRLSPDCVKMDVALLKELQGIIKKEEFEIIKRELDKLLKKEVVLEQKGRIMSQGLSLKFRVIRPTILSFWIFPCR